MVNAPPFGSSVSHFSNQSDRVAFKIDHLLEKVNQQEEMVWIFPAAVDIAFWLL